MSVKKADVKSGKKTTSKNNSSGSSPKASTNAVSATIVPATLYTATVPDAQNSITPKDDGSTKQYDNKASNNITTKSASDLGAGSVKGLTTSNTVASKDIYKSALHGSNLFTHNEIKNNLYTNNFRYGIINPYGAISTAREYLFFTKPDLNIIKINDSTGTVDSYTLNENLGNVPFWVDMANSRANTIAMLEQSLNTDDPFNHLLSNMVVSNLEVPGLSSETIDTPENMYGVKFSYRGSSEASDDNPEFSLEFKDTRYLDTYMFFKAYEEYETLKHHGVIAPCKKYIINRILHDQFAIYKFLVDEDGETILYYGKMYGVMPKSLPRDVFGNPNFDQGIRYTVDFKAAFYEDMKPDILADFNKLAKSSYEAAPYQINPYNIELDRADTRPAKSAFVIKDTTSDSASRSPVGYVYKLRWRGSEEL